MQTIKKRNFENLIEKNWLDKLNYFLQSERFDKLSKMIAKGHDGFTPMPHEIFRAFLECPYNELKLVIVGLDPYPGLFKGRRVADGIAFSSRNSVNQPPKSLEQIYRAIEDDLGIVMDRRNNDLTYLANQGVLFLNSALTTEMGKTGSHSKEWEPFTNFILNMLDKVNPGLLYVFMGIEAQKFKRNITITRNYVFDVEHPAAAVYKGNIWNHKQLFKNIQTTMDYAFNTKLKFNEI